MKITRDCIVELEYQLRDAEGSIVEDSKNSGSLTYLHGNEEIPPTLEEQLDGIEEGAELEVTLGPGVAYGAYNPDGIVSVPRSEFPEDAEIVPGDWISVVISDDESGGDGDEEMEMRVLEISPDAITLDANHPLAGQQVTFDLRVKSVRAASTEEIETHKAGKTAPEE
ncbi:MAG: peptidylprolyl isomerase [Planctomycetota bacterium]